MSVGKYSPTISASYRADQSWWKKNGGGFGNGQNPEADEDNDGFDSYGYSGPTGCGPDRAGYTEMDYLTSFSDLDGLMSYDLYDRIAEEWYGKKIGPAFQ